MFFSKKKERRMIIDDHLLEWDRDTKTWEETIRVNDRSVTVNYVVPYDSDPSGLLKQFYCLNLIKAAYRYTIQNSPISFKLESNEDLRLRKIIVMPVSVSFLYDSCYLGPVTRIITEHNYNHFFNCWLYE